MTVTFPYQIPHTYVNTYVRTYQLYGTTYIHCRTQILSTPLLQVRFDVTLKSRHSLSWHCVTAWITCYNNVTSINRKIYDHDSECLIFVEHKRDEYAHPQYWVLWRQKIIEYPPLWVLSNSLYKPNVNLMSWAFLVNGNKVISVRRK